MIKLGLVVLLAVGTCIADLSTWDEGTGFNMNRNLNGIQGVHFSQHEASVNAARKGAAERLTRIGAGAGTDPCGSAICYSSSGFSDNSDAETLGEGTVRFNAGSAGSSSSSSKYQANSHQESATGAVPVYPLIGSSKSSYASSAQRHSASSVNAAQPVNYISAAEGVKTKSKFGASSETTVVQPIVASAYPIGQESSQSSQYASASRNSNAGVYTVPVDSNNAYRTRSSYTASSERQASGVAQPVYTSSGDVASKYVAASASRLENQQRYVPSNTYVVYRQPVPVPIYAPVSSSGFDSSARFSNSEGNTYRVPVPVVYPVRSTSNQYSAADNQQTYIAHAGQPVYGVSSDHSSLSNQQRSHSQYVRPTYQPVYSNHLAASQQSQSHASDSGSTVGVFVAPVVTSSANRLENEERHEEYSRKGSSYIPITVNPGSTSYVQYVRPSYQPIYTNHVAATQQSQESHSRDSDSGSTVGVVVAPVATSSANRVEAERHEEYSRKGSSYFPVAVNTGSTASKYSAQNEHSSQSGTSYAPLVSAASSESHNQRHNSASSSSQYSAAQQHASNSGSYYPAATAGSHGSRYSASESQNAYNQQRTGGYSPYPITNDALGQRFGSVGIELNSKNNLGGLMSESERLARLQAKNAYNGPVSGSTAVDMEDRFSGANDDVSTDVGGGFGTGFKRTKSWSSSSKWAAGQKFGDDGKIKSYSSLSTGESEQHNINGQKTGYKAATTTLEDDGKVSTYSLHTP
ncbi:uncharacterized protein fon isoform X1 [Ochlerotatus camptorhynchus]|uniref:uncharacterized protein fon isoform X1 n=1 Tax=Ochlerotatus camptorhynchus TaxID=644619 RepID=UPI0031DE903A